MHLCVFRHAMLRWQDVSELEEAWFIQFAVNMLPHEVVCANQLTYQVSRNNDLRKSVYKVQKIITCLCMHFDD